MTETSGNDASSLNRLIAEFLEAQQAGRLIDRADLLARHPELAGSLQAFFANHDRMQELAPLPTLPASDAPVRPTLAASATVERDAPTVAPLRSGTVQDAPTLPPGSAQSSRHAPHAEADGTRSVPATTVRYFGDYELLAEIARGGMGVVYKARQVNLNRIVALKMILAGQLASQDDVQRFYTEAEAAANLDHPGIVPIYEVGQHEGQHYFSMGFVEGESLAARIAAGPLPPQEAAELTKKIAEAIAYAHSKGVIHRDLKPANILLQTKDEGGRMKDEKEMTPASASSFILHTSSFTPRVTDFGLAKKIETESGLTHTGAILGTPSYMPPEQAAGKIVGPLADVYSLGSILYCLLTGRPPFQAASPLDTLLQVLGEEPIAPRQLNPKLPRDLETICLKCLQKDAGKRYESAKTLVDDLVRFLRGEPILARPIGRAERTWRWCKRNPVVAALLLLVAFSLLAGTGVSTMFAVEANQRAIGEAKERKEAQQQTAKAEAQLSRSEWLLYASQIASAQREWEFNNASLALVHLNRTRQDFRGWEHKYLMRQFTRDLRGTVQAHTEPVMSIALSPDGRLLASTSQDKSVRIWKADTGAQLQSVNGGNQFVAAVAFSPSGRKLAGIGADGKLRIWHVDTGEETQVITTHEIAILAASSLAFTPDGSTIVTGNRDRTLKLWDVESGREQKAISLPAVGIFIPLAVSRDSKQIACGLGDSPESSEIRVFDLASGEERLKLTGLAGRVVGVEFNDDGGRLAGSLVAAGNTSGGAIKVWDTATGQETLEIPFRANDLAFSHNGKQIVGGGADGLIKLWDAQSAKELRTFHGASTVTSLAIGQAGDVVVSGDLSGSIQSWNIAETDRQLVLPHESWVYSVDFSADGKQIVSSGDGKKITLWNALTGERIRQTVAHQGAVDKVAFFADGKHLLSKSWDTSIKLWDAGNGSEIRKVGSGDRGSDSISLSPRGDRLALAGRAGSTIHIVDAKTGKASSVLGTGQEVTSVSFGKEGEFLASGDRQGTIVLWDVARNKKVWSANQAGGSIRSIAFSGDGQWIAGVSEKLTLTVWDARSGEKRFFADEPGGVYCVKFSPDGKRLAAGSPDKTIKFWAVESGQQLFSLKGHLGRVFSIAFSPDGQRLASGSDDGTVRVWDSVKQ